MKKLLITGVNGFLGNYFINKYSLNYGIKTFSFRNDNFNSLHVKDVDVVIHLSALVHQMREYSYEEYEKINVTQTLDLAKKAKKDGVRQFVFMSTIAVYGIEKGTINEYTKCKPTTNYGKSKYKAELELKKIEDNNFKVSIIRAPIVNGYNGPGNIKKLLSLINKVPVLPFGGIKNKRSMIYIGNLCYIMDIIIQKEKRGIFLVSDNKSISTTTLIELIAKNLDKKVYLIKIPIFESLLKLIKPSFYKRLYGSLEVDNSETRKILNFKNPYTIEDGIRLMIKGEK